MSIFPCILTINITSHSKNGTWLFIALLRWNMIILPILATSLIHILFKRLGECTFLSSGVNGPDESVGIRTCEYLERNVALLGAKKPREGHTTSKRDMSLAIELQQRWGRVLRFDPIIVSIPECSQRWYCSEFVCKLKIKTKDCS